ncbi:MAG: polysaccharide deacetylase family protein [Clostridia bacterium]
MFSGKMKAVTFSYDDGVTQDIRLIELLNKYSLKATFNINSEKLGLQEILDVGGGVRVNHFKVNADDVRSVYAGHEVAVHTLTHPNLTQLEEAEVIRQVEQDRLNLSELCGYEVVGMAYPCGGINNDDRTAAIIKDNTGVKYARALESSGNFEPQENLYRFKSSVYHMDFEKMMEMAEEFVAIAPVSPKIFYIWGHSYEFDISDSWDRFEKFLEFISGRDDIFYGTNREILLP